MRLTWERWSYNLKQAAVWKWSRSADIPANNTHHIIVLSSLSEDIYLENYYQSRHSEKGFDQSVTPVNVDNIKDIFLSILSHGTIYDHFEGYKSFFNTCSSLYISFFVAGFDLIQFEGNKI